MKITRRQLRQIIKEEISRLSEREVSQKEIDGILNTNWDSVLPKGIVKYDQGKKKRDDVGAVQRALNGLFLLGNTISPGTIDSRYGNNTLKSIRHFQTKTQGLKPDGDYGPNTRKAMIAAFNKAKEEEGTEKEEPSNKAGRVGDDGNVSVNTGQFNQPVQPKANAQTACPPQWADNGNTLWGVNMNMLKNKSGTTIKDVYDKMDGGMQHALSTITKRVHCWHGDPNKERPVPTGKWITYFRTKEDWKKYKKQAGITKRKDGILTKKQQSKIKSEWGNVQFYPLSDNGVQYIVAMQFKNYKTPAKTQPITPKNRDGSVNKVD